MLLYYVHLPYNNVAHVKRQTDDLVMKSFQFRDRDTTIQHALAWCIQQELAAGLVAP